MFQGVQKYCDSKGVNVLWPKMYKRIVTKRQWTVINERVQTVLDQKDVVLILIERIRMDLDHDKNGTNGLWPKACKWVMTENVQMGYDRKGANGRVWKIANGRDRKIANGSWPKGANGRDRKIANGLWQKSANVSWPKGVNGSWPNECERNVTKRTWMDREWKGANESYPKECQWIMTEEVIIDCDWKSANETSLREC